MAEQIAEARSENCGKKYFKKVSLKMYTVDGKFLNFLHFIRQLQKAVKAK